MSFIFIQENAYENVVWKIAAILSQPQCVNSSRPSDAYMSSKLTIIASDNGLSPGRRQAIIWNNDGILSIGLFGTKFSEILIEILTFSFKKVHLKVLSVKWWPFCIDLNVLRDIQATQLQRPQSDFKANLYKFGDFQISWGLLSRCLIKYWNRPQGAL